MARIIPNNPVSVRLDPDIRRRIDQILRHAKAQPSQRHIRDLTMSSLINIACSEYVERWLDAHTPVDGRTKEARG